MSAQELYLRPANATEARGPFPPEQLADLARAGEVTPETLVYDTTREGWVALAERPDLLALAFPPRQRLTLKPRPAPAAAPPAPAPEAEPPSAGPAAPPVPEITEILEESTRTGEAEEARLVRGATLGRRGALAGLLLAAGSGLAPLAGGPLPTSPIAALLAHPGMLLVPVDVVLAALLATGATGPYPFLRFRAAFGLGYAGLLLQQTDATGPGAAMAVGAAGLFACTLCYRPLAAGAAAAAAALGFGLAAWLQLPG
ncbi:MAG: DUF4339 domain-containing protein [Bacteroidetes bacterium]|nr:DUF4339 domain-containing protein [Bacteroidota bacterium]MBM3842586.1 DUF4339 domain-containing protein [Verrucomicrobiota bacterium]